MRETGYQVPNYHRKSRKEDIVTTLFILNVPDETLNFQVRHIKILLLRRAFAFVRYANAEDIEELEAKLIQVFIGNMKVAATVANYGHENLVGARLGQDNSA
ncbi:hypothetical protein QVD17_39514 [Tagetes erecta]|uniref:Uncharacterized protein n=1 Tax=Tagetes erecta TaxID=13708 RepID=A0AAD8JNP5_TARER|nr:hypothetical protein QVD17_39514 [Tagetes erecta]